MERHNHETTKPRLGGASQGNGTTENQNNIHSKMLDFKEIANKVTAFQVAKEMFGDDINERGFTKAHWRNENEPSVHFYEGAFKDFGDERAKGDSLAYYACRKYGVDFLRDKIALKEAAKEITRKFDLEFATYEPVKEIFYDWGDELPCAEESHPPCAKNVPFVAYANERLPTLREPLDGEWNPGEETKRYLEAVFETGDTLLVCPGALSDDGKEEWNPVKTSRDQLITSLESRLFDDIFPMHNPKVGAFVCINSGSERKRDKVACRSCLVESDYIPVERQLALLRELRLPCRAIVHSGNKSLHAVVMIDATSLKEFDRRVSKLYAILDDHGFHCDKQVKDPNRYTRLPGVRRGGKKQFLVETNCGCASWDEWEKFMNLDTDETELETVPANNTPTSTSGQPKCEKWRVTDDEVREAIKETYLGEMTDIYNSVMNPSLSLGFDLGKAISTLGVALSFEESYSGGWDEPIPSIKESGRLAGECNNLLEEESQDSVKLRTTPKPRLKIANGVGLVCNTYVICVAPSASGKDIGDLHEPVVEKMGRLIGTNASAEGFLDGLVKKPNGLLVISEMKNYIDPKGGSYEAKLLAPLTSLFNKHKFEYALSGRTREAKNSTPRKSDYCAPNLYGSIQPGILERKASLENIEDGFWGRCLICIGKPEKYFDPDRGFDKERQLERVFEICVYAREKKGEVQVPDKYSSDFQRKWFDEELDKTEGVQNASLRRLTSEYLPKLAVMVSLGTTKPSNSVELDEVDWERAGILVRWFYGNAKDILECISDVPEKDRYQEKETQKLRKYIEKNLCKGKPIKVRDLYRKAGLTANAAQKAINALVDVGDLVRGDGRTVLRT